MGTLDEVACGWPQATARWLRTAQHMITHATLAMDQESFWQHLQTASDPSDRPPPLEWRAYYWRLVEVTRVLRPRRICEMGVRAGYSALAMLTAAPTAYMLGIEADLDETKENTHCGRKGLYRHALEIPREFNYDLLLDVAHASLSGSGIGSADDARRSKSRNTSHTNKQHGRRPGVSGARNRASMSIVEQLSQLLREQGTVETTVLHRRAAGPTW